YRAGAGLALAIAVGSALGIFMAISRPVNAMLGALVELFYPMPKSALIPVTVLWLGFGDGSKILLIFLGCMLPVTVGAFNGARGSERALVWSARSMGASRLRVLRRGAAERHAGTSQWHPDRAGLLVHPAGELRADRRTARARRADRFSRRQRQL